MVTNNSVNEPTAASGKVLQGQGVGTTSAFSTATYPSIATSTGVILRADGTNWAATTATFPNTTTANQLLYSSATNTVGGLATANSGVLTTNSSGVPSIDTTNFSVLSTGVQVKGNNTNTAPPAGFIGELITATATTGTLTSGVTVNITSISLTAGLWDISSRIIITTSGTVAGNADWYGTISTVSASLVNLVGEMANTEGTGIPVSGASAVSINVGPTRGALSGTTTIYLNFRGTGSVTFTNVIASGTIRAVRVG